MDKKIKLSDFDLLGIIELDDVEGIEKYVTPVYEGRDYNRPVSYLSRSKEYYNVKSMTELSNQREELKKLLTREKSKKNFVILENMLNCSARVYFKKFEEYVINPSELNKHYLEICKLCMIEDTRNLITLFEEKGIASLNPHMILPTGNENCAKRAIEMDNKAILYMFTKHLNLQTKPDETQIVTPGYGSLYIGPFFHVIQGYGFTNIFKSKYIQETTGKSEELQLDRLVSNKSIFDPGKKIVLLDDNVGTGSTIEELKKQLGNAGINCYKAGALQFNWRNYYRIISGDKKNTSKFNINSMDILTPLNYAGHKLYEHAIDMLHSSGTEYKNYMKSKSYGLDICNDIEGSIKRGLLAAKKSKVVISKRQYNGAVSDEDIEVIKNNYGPLQQIDDEKIVWIDSFIELIEAESGDRKLFTIDKER